MNAFKTVMPQRLYEYLLAHSEPPNIVQQKLLISTLESSEIAEIQVPREQAAFLTLLVRFMAAEQIVEIGTFAGYSTLAMALGLPPHGQLIACDISAECSAIARDSWHAAGVANRVEVRLGPAAETLRDPPEAPDTDLVFIEADKVDYIDYWDQLVSRVRPGGILVVDKVLYYGEAAIDNPPGNARAIGAFNDRVRNDDRVESVRLPIADGFAVARKKDL
ncbi:O-methyltransferase [Nocardia sp. NPDC051929]|uniref:O-methyltransferase n=1 Tax=Nocardia sp. NPDC051929 TaxID=3364327 RepID=UPI0037C66F77